MLGNSFYEWLRRDKRIAYNNNAYMHINFYYSDSKGEK